MPETGVDDDDDNDDVQTCSVVLSRENYQIHDLHQITE